MKKHNIKRISLALLTALSFMHLSFSTTYAMDTQKSKASSSPTDDLSQDIEQFINALVDHPQNKKNRTFLKNPKAAKKMLSATLKQGKLVLETIEYLPKEIGKLKNVTSLTIIDSNLTELPIEICQLTNLQNLYLHRTEIKSLPPSFGNLVNLKILALTNSKIEKIPDLHKLLNLEELRIVGSPSLKEIYHKNMLYKQDIMDIQEQENKAPAAHKATHSYLDESALVPDKQSVLPTEQELLNR